MPQPSFGPETADPNPLQARHLSCLLAPHISSKPPLGHMMARPHPHEPEHHHLSDPHWQDQATLEHISQGVDFPRLISQHHPTMLSPSGSSNNLVLLLLLSTTEPPRPMEPCTAWTTARGGEVPVHAGAKSDGDGHWRPLFDGIEDGW